LKFVGQDILKPLKHLERANFCENTLIDVSFNGDPKELEALNLEIATKCQPPVFMRSENAPSADSGKVLELEKLVQDLQAKVVQLESENEMNKAKVAQLDTMTIMMENLQSRMDVVENYFT
jgi:hypothetical protein